MKNRVKLKIKYLHQFLSRHRLIQKNYKHRCLK